MPRPLHRCRLLRLPLLLLARLDLLARPVGHGVRVVEPLDAVRPDVGAALLGGEDRHGVQRGRGVRAGGRGRVRVKHVAQLAAQQLALLRQRRHARPQRGAPLLQDAPHLLVALLDHLAHAVGVAVPRGVGGRQRVEAEVLVARGPVRVLVHGVRGHHLARPVGVEVEVGGVGLLRPGGDARLGRHAVVEHQLLRHAVRAVDVWPGEVGFLAQHHAHRDVARQRDLDAVHEAAARHDLVLLVRAARKQRARVGAALGLDGHALHGLDAAVARAQHPRHQRDARLLGGKHGHGQLGALRQRGAALTLREAVHARVHVARADGGAARAHRRQLRLVHNVGQVRAHQARQVARQLQQVHVGRHALVAQVQVQDLVPPLGVGLGHAHLAVKAARAHERGVQQVRAVGGADEHDARVGREAVHLGQQLVQRLLALLVHLAAAVSLGALEAQRVQLVHKDDAGRHCARALEQVAHTRRAQAHDALRELGARHLVERHHGLARQRLGQQRLARAGVALQQDALGRARAQAREGLGVLEELHHLGHLAQQRSQAGHVLEHHARQPLLARGGLGACKLHGRARVLLQRLDVQDLVAPQRRDDDAQREAHQEVERARVVGVKVQVELHGLGPDLEHEALAQELEVGDAALGDAAPYPAPALAPRRADQEALQRVRHRVGRRVPGHLQLLVRGARVRVRARGEVALRGQLLPGGLGQALLVRLVQLREHRIVARGGRVRQRAAVQRLRRPRLWHVHPEPAPATDTLALALLRLAAARQWRRGRQWLLVHCHQRAQALPRGAALVRAAEQLHAPGRRVGLEVLACGPVACAQAHKELWHRHLLQLRPLRLHLPEPVAQHGARHVRVLHRLALARALRMARHHVLEARPLGCDALHVCHVKLGVRSRHWRCFPLAHGCERLPVHARPLAPLNYWQPLTNEIQLSRVCDALHPRHLNLFCWS
mmetsp:Transcript_5597/g.13952  ORF Transcript_5597/g.13952 Transcript_5597/m.13952 type:complete len:948 (-) Transcript_5597:529-3372(-)